MIQITCINKSNGRHDDPHESIERFGWVNTQTKESGYIMKPDMISWLEKGNKAYVSNKAGNDLSELIVAVSRFGNKYVKTVPDRTGENNLLNLYECAR